MDKIELYNKYYDYICKRIEFFFNIHKNWITTNKDELKQEIHLKIWTAFKKMDIDEDRVCGLINKNIKNVVLVIMIKSYREKYNNGLPVISLNKEFSKDELVYLQNLINSEIDNPLQIEISKEEGIDYRITRFLDPSSKLLSNLEKDVIKKFLDGKNVFKIKKEDNALTRALIKIRKFYKIENIKKQELTKEERNRMQIFYKEQKKYCKIQTTKL